MLRENIHEQLNYNEVMILTHTKLSDGWNQIHLMWDHCSKSDYQKSRSQEPDLTQANWSRMPIIKRDLQYFKHRYWERPGKSLELMAAHRGDYALIVKQFSGLSSRRTCSYLGRNSQIFFS